MTKEQKSRLAAALLKAGIFAGVGIGYALFAQYTGWGIPCLFHVVTGWLCPGCGVSRMFLSLFRLDFVAAARYNLLVLCLLPFGIVLCVHKLVQYVKTGKTKDTLAQKVFYIIAFVLCAVFFVLRNTTSIPFISMP